MTSRRVRKAWAHSDKTMHAHARRARTVGAPGKFGKGDVHALLITQDCRCKYCLEPLRLAGPDRYQIDHFIPLSRGGSNYASNIVLACRACNREKGDRMPWEYRPALFSNPEDGNE